MKITSAKSITVPTDKQGQIVKTVSPHDVMQVLVLLAVSAGLPARGRVSLRKSIMGLKKTGQVCGELRRPGPVLAIYLAPLFISQKAMVAFLGKSLYVVILVGLVFAIFVGWYYIWPLLRWRWAMRWDDATGFRVTRF